MGKYGKSQKDNSPHDGLSMWLNRLERALRVLEIIIQLFF